MKDQLFPHQHFELEYQSELDQAISRLENPLVKERLIQTTLHSLNSQRPLFDCWIAAMYILGQTDNLFNWNYKDSNEPHLFTTFDELPELFQPDFFSLAVFYCNFAKTHYSNLGTAFPAHVGFVIDETPQDPLIWEKVGSKKVEIRQQSEVENHFGPVKFFDTGIK